MHRRSIAILAALPLALAFSRPLHAESVQLRLGAFLPAGGSSFWRSTEDTFTLDARDFTDVAGGFTFTYPLAEHFDLGVNADFFESTVGSAFRRLVDDRGQPIVHDSRLLEVPLLVDLRLLPFGRERASGRHGSLRHARPALYLGGGVGVNYWEYEEIGDFVDDETAIVFFDRFRDDGVAWATHALAGVDLPVGDSWSLVFEGRYLWSEEDLSGDFSGSGLLDLSGGSAFVGAAFRW